MVQHGLKTGVRTRALGAPESVFERMRREMGRPPEQPQDFAPRNPDMVPGAGDLVILNPETSAQPVEHRPSQSAPADD